MTEQLPFGLPDPEPDKRSAGAPGELASRGALRPQSSKVKSEASTAAPTTAQPQRPSARPPDIARTSTRGRAPVSAPTPQDVARAPSSAAPDAPTAGRSDSSSPIAAPTARHSGSADSGAIAGERGTAPPERVVYTVTRLNREVRQLLERGIPLLWLEGELSNFSAPGSGHWYFSLKDREAQIRCAMFRIQNQRVGFTPKTGQHVLIRGRVTMYEARGEYQLVAEHMEEAGVGALKREFERLKAKLSAEGLFAAETKRELPRFPRRIGIITSPTGAAIRDILQILRRRFPPSSVIVYPTPVQGAASVPSIIHALRLANARAECDVLIVSRGGGSLEDLWAFNDEGVARAIHSSKLPVISGVGHEIDFTIADFVADARAPTPSGAAELVVPDRSACLDVLSRTYDRFAVAMRRELRTITARFDSASSRLKVMHPGARLLQQEQRLDDLEQRLAGAMRSTLQKDRSRVSEAYASLIHCSPERRVREFGLRHQALEGRLQNAVNKLVVRAENRLALASRALNTVSPLATLDRGFAIVTRATDGTLVTDTDSLRVGDEIDARVARGAVRAKVTGKIEKKD